MCSSIEPLHALAIDNVWILVCFECDDRRFLESQNCYFSPEIWQQSTHPPQRSGTKSQSAETFEDPAFEPSIQSATSAPATQSQVLELFNLITIP